MNEESTEKVYETVLTESEQTEIAVRRREMSALSEYFERDSRRYDNGFELL